MYKEEEFLQLSALQHFVFCQRQCALIHIEQMWAENQFTAEGRIMHVNAHEEGIQNLRDVRIERGVFLHSFELGLVGKADVVEFHRVKGEKSWKVFPVEYKRGKPKEDNCDRIQLCAQAFCLEEMLKVKIQCGVLFYGRTRHRVDVCLDDSLRYATVETVKQLRNFIEEGKTPMPVYTAKCKSCSFFDECLPKTIGRKVSVRAYLENEIKEAMEQ